MARKGRLGTGNTSYGYGWGYFPRTSPRKVKGGVTLAGGRGVMARSWWSRRWIEVLESFGWANRLARGRSYARKGQALELRLSTDGVEARVQGSRPQPYRVTIRLKALPPAVWRKVAAALREDAGLVARLLAGEVPEEMERVFKNAGASLLPKSSSDLKTDCSCPDTANPCKHIAAVHYLLAERFDQDPFLIFLLRGKKREEVLDAVSGPAVAGPETVPGFDTGPEAPGVNPLEEDGDLLAYWRPGPRFASAECTPHPPDIEHAILRRVGQPQFCVAAQAKAIASALGKAYDIVTGNALAAARGEQRQAGPPEGGDLRPNIGGRTQALRPTPLEEQPIKRQSRRQRMPKHAREEWDALKRRYHLSEKQVAMARELGMNPRKFGKIAPNRDEPWKAPIGEFIERLHIKRFGRK